MKAIAQPAHAHTPAPSPAATASVEKFLTPEAMLTPGAAGGIIVLIANTLHVQFELPAGQIGLLLSFLFGLLAIVQAQTWWQKLIYYVLNSLIIFCVAFGAGQFTPPPEEPAKAASTLPGSWLTTPAYAQDQPGGGHPVEPPAPGGAQPTPSTPTTTPTNGQSSQPARPVWQNPIFGKCSILNNPLGRGC